MDKISSKHFLFLILGVTTISITSYSSLFIRLGGRDSWIYSIICYVLAFIMFYILINGGIKTYTLTFPKVFTYSLGNILGKLFLFLFAIGAFITSIESASSSAMSIHTNFFIETPTWFSLFIMLFPTIYLLTRSENVIVILTIITMTFSTIGTIILTILIQKYCDYTNLLPIFKNGFSLTPIFMMLGSLGALSLTLPFINQLKNTDKLKSRSFITYTICSIIIVTSFLSAIGTFGPYRAGNIYFPEYVASQRAQIAGFIEFGELFYIFKTVTGWLIKYIISYFCVYSILKPKIKNKYIFASLYAIIVFFISATITENGLLFFNLLVYYNFISLILLVLVPLITYIFLIFRK